MTQPSPITASSPPKVTEWEITVGGETWHAAFGSRDVLIIASSESLQGPDIVPRCDVELTKEDIEKLKRLNLPPEQWKDEASIMTAKAEMNNYTVVGVERGTLEHGLTREYVLKRIERLMNETRKQGGKEVVSSKEEEITCSLTHTVIVYYYGPGKRNTGDWCFEDGYITFRGLAQLYCNCFKGRVLLLETDCSYSGSWVKELMEFLEEQGVRPCGHSAREKGKLMKAFASCQPTEIPYRLLYSVRVSYDDEHTGTCETANGQHVYWFDPTSLRCNTQLFEMECTISTEYTWEKALEQDNKAKARLEKYMQEGYVLCDVRTLLLIGIAGVGKTSFLQIVFNLPPPEIRESTPLAKNAIRAISISSAKANKKGSKTKWQKADPEDILNYIAERISQGTFQHDQNMLFTFPHGTSPPKQQKLEHSLQKPSETCSPTHQGSLETREITPVDEFIKTERKPLYQNLKTKKCVKYIMKVIKASGQPFAPVKIFDEVYMVDTGGQPQFNDLLPTFIHTVSGAVIFVKLNESLDSHPEIAYYSEGGHLCGTPYISPLIHMETIKNNLQAMQSRRNSEGEIEWPKIFCIGTHKDLVEQCDEDIPTKNERLLKQFRMHKKVGENIVYYSPRKPEELIYPVNAKEPQDQDHDVAEKFRQAVMKECSPVKRKIPFRWFILEKLMEQLSIDKETSVLRLEECQKEACDLEMNDADIQAALKYLDQLNIIKYFPRELPNVVFTTAQVFLDKISELVQHSHYIFEEILTAQMLSGMPAAVTQ